MGGYYVFLRLCCLVAVFFRCEGAGCTFFFPSITDSNLCDGYDLSKIASLGGANFTSTFSYVFTVCDNIPASAVPAVCRSNPLAPAYQYNNESCHALGSLSSPFAVSA